MKLEKGKDYYCIKSYKDFKVDHFYDCTVNDYLMNDDEFPIFIKHPEKYFIDADEVSFKITPKGVFHVIIDRYNLDYDDEYVGTVFKIFETKMNRNGLINNCWFNKIKRFFKKKNVNSKTIFYDIISIYFPELESDIDNVYENWVEMMKESGNV